MKKFLSVFSIFVLWSGLLAQVKTENFTAEKYASFNVLFLRHAYAPGGGDPENFQIKKCSTQRNLDKVGREQAKKLGAKMREQGIRFQNVYSSQWCRCLETAKWLAMGEVKELPYLNSYFQGLVPKEPTLNGLRQFLSNLEEDGLTLMVTHFVVIRDITGMSVASGETVAYDTTTGKAVRVDF